MLDRESLQLVGMKINRWSGVAYLCIVVVCLFLTMVICFNICF